ncbi:MAG: hypothetical protein H7Y03_03455 [Chitinophagaceae bacterium]|nr:hypothetical protein [Chitinophagaceae bacterium]
MKNILHLLLTFSVVLNLSCSKDSASRSDVAGSGTGGSLARFAIVGNYMYIVDYSDLKVLNIMDPSNPVLKNTTPVGFEIETIYPFKDKLFIGSTSVVHIFSVTDPEHPQKLSTAISPEVLRRCDPVVAKDSVAYATLRTNGTCGGTQSILAAYDIKDITNPVQKSTFPVTEPYGLGYADSALYVCDKSGLLVFDIRNGYYPNLVKTLSDGPYIDVIPYNDILICWVKNGLALYNIRDRFKPEIITKIQ